MTDEDTSLTALIIDDEPHNILWLSDYLEDGGFTVTMKTDVNQGVDELQNNSHRISIIDLNIPVFPPLSADVASKGDLYSKYPGLYAAWRARNSGYRNRQVVVYTVHRDPEIAAEAERLRCTYIMKGRPKMLKEEIESILSYDPTKKS
ncbi:MULTISPECIES: response regulator [unclassified Sphingomonas]|uniref:response regulator n=1 Tax=unclassified Sphingomonas TaxID=196159 RepID=UPI001269737D|nr:MULTISPECIES: response regulator [unclassified Sphingomonas]MDY1008701.1 response regulator [Sphingomonas sp. CFBP9019]